MPSPAFLLRGEGSRGAGAPGGNTPVIELLPDAGFVDTPSRDVAGDRKPTSVTGGSSDVVCAGANALDASEPVRPRILASSSTAFRCWAAAVEAIVRGLALRRRRRSARARR